MEDAFLTPKRVRKSIIPEGNSGRRRNLFDVEVEDDIVPLSPTSSELNESPRTPGVLSPLSFKSNIPGVTELGTDTGIISAKTFYGVADKSPIRDAKSLLERVRQSLPESYHRIKMRLSFDDEPPTRKKRARSAGNGESAKRLKKKQKLQYIPFKPKTKKRPLPPPQPKPKQNIIGNKKVKYNWELFGTPSRKFLQQKPSTFDLTPPASSKKSKIPLLRATASDYIDSDSESEENKGEKNSTNGKEPILKEFQEIMQDIVQDQEEDENVRNEVNQLLHALDDIDDNSKENEKPSQVITPQKLFPIFISPKTDLPCTPCSTLPSTPLTPLSSRVHRMGLGEDQLQLDVGQKNLREIECPECHLFYCKGLPEDEIRHEKYHMKDGAFKFKGWKDERIVGLEGNNRIIQVKNSDPRHKWDRALKVMLYVDKELGFPQEAREPQDAFLVGSVVELKGKKPGTTKEKKKGNHLISLVANPFIFLYIMDKQVIGVVGCIGITEAYKVLDVGIKDPSIGDVCSEETYPAWCGLSRIWVDPRVRGKGVATQLVDSVRRNYIYGVVLARDQIAFSSPTVDGKQFAEHYCQRKDYLVYL